jgi:pimeloyl-ACP methyl ester carboxylesterase
LGWSWGSVLGVEMVRARPDLFDAYVGTGQVVDMARGETLSYFGAIDRLRAKGDERGAAALEGVGPPPYPNLKALGKQRKLLISTMPKAERHAMRRVFLDLLLGPDAKLKDVPDTLGGVNYSLKELWTPLMEWSLQSGGLAFDVPVVFIEGELDMQVPSPLVTEVAARLQAPKVELVTLEGAAHAAPITHGGEFLKALVDKVRPLVVGKAKPARKRKR